MKMLVGMLLVVLFGILAVSCGGGDSVFDLEVGDCINSTDDEEVENVETVPCDEPHDYEVFALVDHPVGSNARFPANLAAASFDLCLAFFDEYVGAPYADSLLDIDAYIPTRDSWADGDREVACLLFDLEDYYMTGSMKSSGR